MAPRWLAVWAVAMVLCERVAAGNCAHLNNCNGHGVCDTANYKCNCFNGWGSATDVATYKAPDCSARECWVCCVLEEPTLIALTPPPLLPQLPRRRVPF